MSRSQRTSSRPSSGAAANGWLRFPCHWLALALTVLTGYVHQATIAAAEPAPAVATNGPASSIRWTEERQFWAFRPPELPPRPAVSNPAWPRQPLDAFILSRLDANGLKPAPEASRHAWYRRVHFALTGLPPRPEAIEEFEADDSPGARERAVDRLLASPAYGEHLASLWLPLVRYAEDQAHQVGDDSTYFYPNAWRYRSWVIGAFNRDLPYDRFVMYQLAADRFASAGDEDIAALGLLGLGPKYYDRGRLAVQAEEWEDRVDTVCRTLLGLTVACARCHDHKFEPITMTDYYALAGVFASSRMVNQRPDGFVEKDSTPASRMQVDTRHVVAEGAPRDLNVFLRGNVDRKGPVAERRFLQVLAGDTPGKFAEGSGRRELALAMAGRSNALTARVFVNRLWAEFFGHPIVATPSNFGHSGSRPTHPELLDDLAVRFMEQGWSVKTLVREFVLSSTYAQKSPDRLDDDAARNAKLDPGNQWFGHMPRTRLGIESWRDAMLFVTGELQSADGPSTELSEPANRRRTVYARISRLKLDDTLMQFDYPDANVHAEKRNTTTTAIQKLFALNSPFVLARASALADRASREAGEATEPRVTWLYRTLFGRTPSSDELGLAVGYLAKSGKDRAAWERYAQALLGSNEFAYLD